MQGTLTLDLAIDLDDRKVVTELDPKGMFALTEAFPSQCRQALEIAGSVRLPLLDRRPNAVVVSGMGGSGSGGDFVKALFDSQGSAPLIVNRDYGLPGFLGVGDIVFCASYSGNTEETLAAYSAAKRSGARVVAVTSGGELASLAATDGFSIYRVPGGQPPRTALGFMLIPIIVACQNFRLIHAQNLAATIEALESTCRQLTVEAKGNPAKTLARQILGTLPIIYGLGGWQGLIANRWRCQINENAKQLAFAGSYPELDHNEILGWFGAERQGVAKYTGVLLEGGDETEKMKLRAGSTERLIGDKCRFEHIRAEGDTLLKKMLSLAYFGDFVSLYLARLNGVDPERIDWIDQLKGELGNQS